MGRMNTGEAFERQAATDLNSRFGHLGVSFASHGSGDDAFSNDLTVTGRKGLRDIEVKQAKAPTGQFTLANEDGTIVWSDTSRCIGATLDETVALIDWLNARYPDPEALFATVMFGKTTVPVLADPRILAEWVRKYLCDIKGNDILVTGTMGDAASYGCIDLRVPGCLDGLITASVRKRTSGTRDVPPARIDAAAAAVAAHLAAQGVPAGSFSLESRDHRGHPRLHVVGGLPAWGRRDARRYVMQPGGDCFYISPNDQAVRLLSAGAGNPCFSFWGDFRSVPAGLGILESYLRG